MTTHDAFPLVHDERVTVEQVADRCASRHAAMDLAHTFLSLAADLFRRAEDLETFYNCRESEAVADAADSIRLTASAIGRAKVANVQYLCRVRGVPFDFDNAEYRDLVERLDGPAGWLAHRAHAGSGQGSYDDLSSPITRGIAEGWRDLTAGES